MDTKAGMPDYYRYAKCLQRRPECVLVSQSSERWLKVYRSLLLDQMAGGFPRCRSRRTLKKEVSVSQAHISAVTYLKWYPGEGLGLELGGKLGAGKLPQCLS